MIGAFECRTNRAETAGSGCDSTTAADRDGVACVCEESAGLNWLEQPMLPSVAMTAAPNPARSAATIRRGHCFARLRRMSVPLGTVRVEFLARVTQPGQTAVARTARQSG